MSPPLVWLKEKGTGSWEIAEVLGVPISLQGQKGKWVLIVWLPQERDTSGNLVWQSPCFSLVPAEHPVFEEDLRLAHKKGAHACRQSLPQQLLERDEWYLGMCALGRSPCVELLNSKVSTAERESFVKALAELKQRIETGDSFENDDEDLYPHAVATRKVFPCWEATMYSSPQVMREDDTVSVFPLQLTDILFRLSNLQGAGTLVGTKRHLRSTREDTHEAVTQDRYITKTDFDAFKAEILALVRRPKLRKLQCESDEESSEFELPSRKKKPPPSSSSDEETVSDNPGTYQAFLESTQDNPVITQPRHHNLDTQGNRDATFMAEQWLMASMASDKSELELITHIEERRSQLQMKSGSISGNMWEMLASFPQGTVVQDKADMLHPGCMGQGKCIACNRTRQLSQELQLGDRRHKHCFTLPLGCECGNRIQCWLQHTRFLNHLNIKTMPTFLGHVGVTSLSSFADLVETITELDKRFWDCIEEKNVYN